MTLTLGPPRIYVPIVKHHRDYMITLGPLGWVEVGECPIAVYPRKRTMKPYHQQRGIEVYQGHAPAVLAELPEQSVQMCVTSPPYWALRSYLPDDHPDKAKELGSEPTPEEYVANMVEVFRGVWRVLRDDGCIFVNMGDSYNTTTSGTRDSERWPKQSRNDHRQSREFCHGLKPKDLIGMPWRLAFALQANGWYLRQDIIWAKPNPMPESVRDRCTKAHEYLFLLTKRPRYFFDAEAIREAADPKWEVRYHSEFNVGKKESAGCGRPGEACNTPGVKPYTGYRNRRSVWTIPSESFPGAHFATFPRRLIEPCVMAGTSDKGCCPECGKAWVRVVSTERVRTRPGHDSKTYDRTSGEVTDDGEEKPWRDQAEIGKRDPGRHVTETTTLRWEPGCDHYPFRDPETNCGYDPVIPCTVLDPFHGAGTTAVVAKSLGRHYIGIELNAEYIDLSIPRLRAGASRPKKQEPLQGQQSLFD